MSTGDYIFSREDAVQRLGFDNVQLTGDFSNHLLTNHLQRDTIPSVGNGKKNLETTSRVREMAKNFLRRLPECEKWQKNF